MSNDKQKESFLWQRYLFWRDMEDLHRANYWFKRIEEFNNDEKKLLKEYHKKTNQNKK